MTTDMIPVAGAPRDPGGAGGLRPAARLLGRFGCMMARGKLSREANLRSSIYRGDDGYWYGRVTMGVHDGPRTVGTLCRRTSPG